LNDKKEDIAAPESGIPDRMKVKRRRYTMSPAALEARRKNSQKAKGKCTGPRTEEGKHICSRNSWKHGLYAKSFVLGTLGRPCKSTCDKFPCDLVADNDVTPGETCLDRRFVAESFDSIIKSIELKKHADFNHLAALEMAGALQILRRAKEDILEDGVVIKSEKIDKDGGVIGFEYRVHPALAVYTKLLGDLGLTPNDFVMTPREINRAERHKDKEETDTAGSIMAKALQKLIKPQKEDRGDDD